MGVYRIYVNLGNLGKLSGKVIEVYNLMILIVRIILIGKIVLMGVRKFRRRMIFLEELHITVFYLRV